MFGRFVICKSAELDFFLVSFEISSKDFCFVFHSLQIFEFDWFLFVFYSVVFEFANQPN